MSKIIKAGYTETELERYRRFQYADDSGSVLSFECDKDGKPIKGEHNAESFAACISGVVRGRRVIDNGVQTVQRTYHIPAEIECDCRMRLVMYSAIVNRCSNCGASYTGSGQRLARG